jgi:hypothetical protein
MLEFVWMTRAEYSVTGVVGTLPYGSNPLLEGGRERERERREMEIFVRVCVCLVQGDWLVQLGWILVRARAERSRGGGGAKDETELWVGCQPLALQQSEGVEDERATANCLRVCHSTVLCFFFSLHLSSRV